MITHSVKLWQEKMNSWEVENLGEDISHKKGFAFKSEWFQDHGIAVVKATNFTENSIDSSNLVFVSEKIAIEKQDYKLFPNDIIIQTVGSWTNNPDSVVGKVVRVPTILKRSLLNQNAVILRPNNKIDNGFLFYLLKDRSFKGYIINTAQGAANQASITLESIFRFSFYLPPINVQRKVVAVLSAYDDLIENNDRRIALLEKMAEEIYREWFVRLRFPGHEQVTFHKGIPEGWERKRFDEFCLLQRGFDLPDDKVKPGIYPVVASTSIKTYHSEFKVQPPVITTGRSGSLGTVLFVNSPAWALNTTLFVKNFFSNSPYLIFYTLKFLKLENFNAGAGVPTLNRNHLGGLYMSVSPKELQNKFDEKISVIFQQKENLIRANVVLKQTRDRLLTRLISGKLSVEDLDIQFLPSMSYGVHTSRRI